ncbi:MAG: sulfurtransferase TusA family protein [Emcibacteraceae bacterium]|nr:sulfurtransferase TusA family protein [Emcibacteraceae bacterium]MDG1858462.1 sulfurtransferase TusA family protein [Emcibacteraceae bacterium]
MTQSDNLHDLDVSDHKCPIPVLRLRRLLEKLKVGECVKLIATDPMTLIDVPNFCRESGHVVEEQQEKDDNFLYIIKKC